MSLGIKAAVLVENHPYDVAGFQHMLNSFTGCACYVQPVDLFVRDDINNMNYDTVLWYSMNWDPPAEDSPLDKYMRLRLGTTRQGIMLLHHALLSFQKWELFTRVSGVRERGADGLFQYHQDQEVRTFVVGEHPITAGITDFTVTDETYTIGEPLESGNTPVLRTDNATSIKTIAWTRQYGESRVFCYASGHDNKVYASESFRRVVRNGLLWTAGLL
ncbi:MAG: ThuA domain-containing protein [Clostridiales bacterium]|jgi:trehalose utilization protein|nr:ThuA domain-containing protein [Clostridiales bacterium]